MAKIHLLDEHIANQIAAGEVIERPSSIVKELVENSIDANSSAITIEVKGGGISFIRITDNGEGMTAEDALISFERHATSKIRSIQDLNNIHTLGFRGEALASIAAVTQMKMITRAKNSISGIQIINHGGDIISRNEIGSPEGTTIIVENLFFNTPARLKFLKSPRSETAHISNLVSKLILAHPEISFKYINEGRIIYHSPGDGKMESAIFSIYGKKVIDQLIKIYYKDDSMNIELTGFLGKPSLSRTNRKHQSFFINGRYVKSPLLSNSVENAYKNYLTANHFPWIILNLSIPSQSVDVNVHPTKTEVRFKEEDKIYQIVYNAILEVVNNQNMIPEVKNKPVIDSNKLSITNINGSFSTNNQIGNKGKEKINLNYDNLNFLDSLKTENVEESRKKIYISNTESRFMEKPKTESKLYDDSMKQGSFDNTIKSVHSPFKIIGTLFSTYVIIEEQDRILFIDQHAAHERIIFEEYKEMFSKQKIVSQQLLPPVVIEVTHAEQMILEDSITRFHSLGFEIEPFGERTYLIRGIPTLLGPYNIKEFFQDLLDQSKGIKPETRYELRTEEIMQMACKKAVKARDSLSDMEIAALVEKIKNKKIPLTCPHGRPIIVSLSHYELKKMFKRIQ